MTNNTPDAGATANDKYTELCVVCNGRPCAPRYDFCAECIEEGLNTDNFGRCYPCRDFHDHESCVGVPCQCPCPSPDQIKLQCERDAVLAKLTPRERAILGF